MTKTNVWVAVLAAKCQSNSSHYNYPRLSYIFVGLQRAQVFWNFELKLSITDFKFRLWFTAIGWYLVTKFEMPSKHDTLGKFS